jgi:hypothetical protein
MENFPAVADWFQGTGIGLSGSPIVSQTQVLLSDLSILSSIQSNSSFYGFQGLMYANLFANSFGL